MAHPPMPHARLLVMHPDPILSAGLVAALRQQPTFEVFVDEVDHRASDWPDIDVVIADYYNAMQLTDREVRKSLGVPANARTLAVTADGREANIRRAIEAGVYGYLLVGGSLDELIDGVTAVASGLRYLGVSAAQRMADALTRVTLTSREIEVLKLVASGQSNKSIARQLRIELGTVKSHVGAIMTKLDASSRTHAASIAASRGLLESDPHAATGGHG